MRKCLKFGVAAVMMALLAAGCADSTTQADQAVGKVETTQAAETEGKTEPAADSSLSAEEQAAIEAELAAKEEAEKNAEQSTTAAHTTAASTESQLSTDAIVNGTLIYQDKRSCYMLADYNSAEGWLILFDADGKGYGTPYNAVNINTGMEIWGGEGAEVPGKHRHNNRFAREHLLGNHFFKTSIPEPESQADILEEKPT